MKPQKIMKVEGHMTSQSDKTLGSVDVILFPPNTTSMDHEFSFWNHLESESACPRYFGFFDVELSERQFVLVVTPSGIAGLQNSTLVFFHGWPFVEKLFWHCGRDSSYRLVLGDRSLKLTFSFVNILAQFQFVSLALERRRAFTAMTEAVAPDMYVPNGDEKECERAVVWNLVENGHALQSKLQTRRSARRVLENGGTE
jgi:hypothetical protein